MIKDFKYFIGESVYDSFSETITSEIFDLIKKTDAKKAQHMLSYDKPICFDLGLSILKVSTFSTQSDLHFSSLPWEDINFKRHGCIIDANTYIPVSSTEIPEVEFVIVIDTDHEPALYETLYFKILKTVRHELEHILQHTFNKSSDDKSSQDSYKYFLLTSEIPSMVKGMQLSALKKRVPIDKEFEDYLVPFLESGFMSQTEFNTVIKAWLSFAIKKFPTVKISNKYINLVKPNDLG